MALAKQGRGHSTNKWLVMALVGLAQFVVVLDATIVNVALPSMQKALNISPENLQWVVTAYTLAFGGFLLLGGRAADLIGRKKLFIIGITAFAIASFSVGIATNETLVIVARGVQGLAAALMSPAALSIILTTFKEGKERNKALGIWGGIASSGAAAGLLLGGVLTQYLNWRWNFFVNVPVGILVALAAFRLVPESKAELGHRQFDFFGAVTVTAGLMLLVYALVKAPTYGWTDTKTIGMLAGSAVLIATFLINEAKIKNPLMPLSIFRIRNLSAANATMFPMIAAMFAMFFFMTLYVQQILGYSPVKTGLAFVPVAIVIGIVAGIASQLVTKIGFKPLMVVGPLFVAGALFGFAQLPVDGSYWANIFPFLVIMAIGMGFTFVAGTISATNGVPAHQSGLASGLLNTTQQIGGALGLAILSAVFTAKYTRLLGEIHGRPEPAQLTSAAVQGYHSAFYVGCGFAILSSLIALIFVRQKKGEKVEFDPAAMAGA